MKHYYSSLIKAVKKNKKYQAITDTVLVKILLQYMQRNPQQKQYLHREKSAQFKRMVHAIRAELHAVHGRFQTSKKHHRAALLQTLPRSVQDILATNTSTNERLEAYPMLYAKLFAITGKPRSILDLGCGLNPVSFSYMGLKTVQYYAYDIDTDDVAFLNEYFKCVPGIHGKALVQDITTVASFPEADVAFLFKVIDPLERGKGHRLSEQLIARLRVKYIIASFSTRTVSGRAMRYPKRGWFEQMLRRRGLLFKKIPLKNEVFYVIRP